MAHESGAKKNKYRLLMNLIDKTSFVKIFVYWVMTLVAFSFIYQIIGIVSSQNNLVTKEGIKVSGFIDTIYYSFITATSTGFGDIVPHGVVMKILAVFNVVIGIVMMALITSKIVSLKQERLLEQIYSVSLSERISRLLNGLASFSEESKKLIALITDHPADRKELFAVKMSLSALKHNLQEVKEVFSKNDELFLKKRIVQGEQIINATMHVFENLESIANAIAKKEMTFKSPGLPEDIYLITNLGEQIVSFAKKDYPELLVKFIDISGSIREIQTILMEFKISESNGSGNMTVLAGLFPEETE